MAIDLTLIADHDILIERIAIRVNAKRGHRAIHTSYLSIPASGSAQITTREAYLTFASIQTANGADPVFAVFFNGTITDGQSILVMPTTSLGYSPLTIPMPGVLADRGLSAQVISNTGGPYMFMIQWYEHCACRIGHHHRGHVYMQPDMSGD